MTLEKVAHFMFLLCPVCNEVNTRTTRADGKGTKFLQKCGRCGHVADVETFKAVKAVKSRLTAAQLRQMFPIGGQLDAEFPLAETRDSVLGSISPIQRKGNPTLAARLWGRVLILVERRWLRANGWLATTDGSWLLPPWHPKYVRDRRSITQPYDHTHAVNSLKKHTVFVSTGRWKGPAVYPGYIRYATLPMLLWCFGFLLNVLMMLSTEAWLKNVILLAVLASNLLGFALHLRIRRELQLDYAEDQLRKGSQE